MELHVLDDLCTDVLVELASQGAVLHHESLLDGRRGELDVQGLILDEDVGSVALNDGTHDFGPCLDETVLVVGGLNAVDAHELLDDCVDAFGVALSHE